ncbi:MAG TPA: hypothetical protein VMV17_23445 [Streptosporangiaceae bacterium]|nr:hypothetical protein [Streptosporangiaceae bacterium]
MTPAQDPVTAYARDAVTLTRLRAEHPHLAISIEHYGGARAWVARGREGSPWVIISDDLDRFRAALDGPQ